MNSSEFHAKLRACAATAVLFAGAGALVACAAGRDGDGDGRGDALMMSDNIVLTRSADGWVANPPGAAANVVMAPKARLRSFDQVSPNCNLFQAVTVWDSVEGVSPITMTTSRQTATATWNGTGYAVSGLFGDAVFAPEDELAVEYQGASSPVTEVVVAPAAPLDPASSLGEPAGLATTFHMPADIDVMFTYVYAPDINGDNGLLCEYDVSQLDSDDTGGLMAPVVDTEAADAFADSGFQVASVSVAYYNVLESDSFFPEADRPIPIQAGRMFTVSGFDLGLP